MCVVGAVGTPDRGLSGPWVEIAGAAAIAAPELPNARCYEKNAIHQFAVRQGTPCARAYRARPDGFDIVDGPHVIVHGLMVPHISNRHVTATGLAMAVQDAACY